MLPGVGKDMPPGFDVVAVIGPDGKAWQDCEVVELLARGLRVRAYTE